MGSIRKKCKVVMLPTKDKSQVCLNTYINNTHNCSNLLFNLVPTFNYEDAKSMGFEYQHLYITSDDEIKEGDWCWDEINDKIFQFIHFNSGVLHSNSHSQHEGQCQKIIATTDKSLKANKIKDLFTQEGENKFYNLPQLPKAFIKDYCKVSGIDEVIVEYEPKNQLSNLTIRNIDKYLRVKTNSTNEILLYPVKNSWNREEVEEIVDLYESIINGDFFVETKENMKKRIQQILN